MAVSRTLELTDLTPTELAEIFSNWADDKQAAFFSAAFRAGAHWGGGGWCRQACCIVEKLDDDGKKLIERLADHYALHFSWVPSE